MRKQPPASVMREIRTQLESHRRNYLATNHPVYMRAFQRLAHYQSTLYKGVTL